MQISHYPLGEFGRMESWFTSKLLCNRFQLSLCPPADFHIHSVDISSQCDDLQLTFGHLPFELSGVSVHNIIVQKGHSAFELLETLTLVGEQANGQIADFGWYLVT